MTDVEHQLVREYDHLECPVGTDPFEWLDSFRGERTPWSSRHGGFWLITRQADYLEVIRDHQNFKSESTIPPTPMELIPIFTDPPEHTVYRQFLTPVLSPNSVARWEEFTRAHARSFAETVAERGECDFVGAFARPLPLSVFGMFMGLEADQIARLEALVNEADDIHRSQDSGSEAIVAMAEALGAIVEERMATSAEGDDLPRRLARAEVDGRKLTSAELLNICHTMFVAGFDTTAGMLAMAARFFAMNDDVRRTVANDLSRLPNAIEEIVRLHAFVQSSRRVQSDVDVAGVHMRAGDQVLLPTSLANRDPSAVECPVEFDLDRSPNRHYGFGAGHHRCVGSHLARMELRVGLEEWFRQIPEFRLADGFQTAFIPGHVIGVSELRLVWPTRGARG